MIGTPARRAALIARARRRFGAVLPCGSRKRLRDCFTMHPDGRLIFWYNSGDGNTRIELERKEELLCNPTALR